LINNHIVYNPDAEEDVRAPTHPEVFHHVSAGEASVTTQQLLTNIRDNFPKRHPDLEEQMELTTQTDDDPINEVFNHVGNGGITEDDDDADDEIVWNPRYGLKIICYLPPF